MKVSEVRKFLESVEVIKFYTYKPKSNYEFFSDNSFIKQDILIALYYFLKGKPNIVASKSHMEYLFNRLKKMGLHPMILSCFLRHHFNVVVTESIKCKYAKSADFQVHINASEDNSYKKIYQSVSKRSKSWRKMIDNLKKVR